MLAGDDKSSVLCEVGLDDNREIAYSPYGHSAGGTGALGYNGEVREAHVGWYLLGNGYRAFNPGLMRFHSPDSWSPFGEGGMNAYTYAMGDPVIYKDPTGHSIFGAIARAFTLSTKSAGAELIPPGLKMLGGNKKSARLFKITRRDVNNSFHKTVARRQKTQLLNEKIESLKHQRAYATNKADQDYLLHKIIQKSNHFDNALSRYKSSDLEYKFLSEHVGQKAITRHSSDDLARYAPRQPKPQDGHQQYMLSREIQPPSQSALQQRQKAREIRGQSDRKTLGVNPD